MEGGSGGQAPSVDPQDELDNLREMREMVLGRLYKIIQEKKEKILKSLMLVSSQPLWVYPGSGLALLAFLSSASGVPVSHLPCMLRDRLFFCPQKTQKPYEKILMMQLKSSHCMKSCTVWFREVRAPGRPGRPRLTQTHSGAGLRL